MAGGVREVAAAAAKLEAKLGVAVEEDGGFGELPELASFVSAFLVRWPTHPPDLGLAVAHLPRLGPGVAL